MAEYRGFTCDNENCNNRVKAGTQEAARWLHLIVESNNNEKLEFCSYGCMGEYANSQERERQPEFIG